MKKRDYVLLSVNVTAVDLINAVIDSKISQRRWTQDEATAITEMRDDLKSYVVNEKHHKAERRHSIATAFECYPGDVLNALEDAVGEDDPRDEFWDRRVAARLRKLADKIDLAIDASPTDDGSSP